MTEIDSIRTGRPVRLVPTAPGFWMTMLGVAIAALSPLLGFLIGVSRQRPEGDVVFSPLYVGLFVGVMVGGLGVVLAVVGGVRLWRHLHRESVAEPVGTEATEGGLS